GWSPPPHPPRPARPPTRQDRPPALPPDPPRRRSTPCRVVTCPGPDADHRAAPRAGSGTNRHRRQQQQRQRHKPRTRPPPPQHPQRTTSLSRRTEQATISPTEQPHLLAADPDHQPPLTNQPTQHPTGRPTSTGELGNLNASAPLRGRLRRMISVRLDRIHGRRDRLRVSGRSSVRG